MWLSRLVREAQKTKKSLLSIVLIKKINRSYRTLPKKKTEQNRSTEQLSTHSRRRCKEEHEEAKIRFQSTGDSGVSISSPVHQYFRFKFFFFFFPYQSSSFFRPKPTDIRPIRSDSARIGAYRHATEPNRRASEPNLETKKKKKKKLDTV